jgi:hypothetical protein
MTGAMKDDDIRKAIALLREEWRRARDEKLSRKRELVAGAADIEAVRRDRRYRAFRKEQRRCAARLRHLERRLNRKLAHEEKES